MIVGPSLSTGLTLDPPAVSWRATIWAIPYIVLGKTGNPVQFDIPIPNEPILVGQMFGVQAGSLEQTNSFRLTDSLKITIQK